MPDIKFTADHLDLEGPIRIIDSGKQVAGVSSDGTISATGFRGAVTAYGLYGSGFGDNRIIRAYSDISVRRVKYDADTQKFVGAYPEDQSGPNNIALSHEEHDTLAINRGDGYSGGVRIEGAVNIPGSLTLAGRNVHAELVALRADVEALKHPKVK